MSIQEEDIMCSITVDDTRVVSTDQFGPAYVEYTVSTKANSSETVIKRRFSDFLWLVEMLERTTPGCIIPPLPYKDTLSQKHLEKDFIAARARKLQKFLDRCSTHDELSTNSYLSDFLTAPDGLKSARMTSEQLKPKRLSGVFESLSRTWTQFYSNSGKQAQLTPTDEDAEVATIQVYAQSFEKTSLHMVKQAENLVEHRKRMAASYRNLSDALLAMGKSEGEGYGTILTKAGDHLYSVHETSKKHALEENIRFLEPMDELARFVVSLNRSIEHREEKRKDYIHALTVLEALEKEKKTASQTSDTSSASKKGEEIESNKLLAESAKEMLDTTTKRLLGDFNKFRKEREAHLKIILTEFSKMNSEETLEFQKVWATYSEDIEEDLQSTDQEVTDSSKLAQLLSQSNNNNF